MRRRRTDELADLQAALLQCGWPDGCQRISEWVCVGLSRSLGDGRRTDVVVVGFCREHERAVALARGFEVHDRFYATQGATEWAGVGALLEEVERGFGRLPIRDVS